MSATRTGYSVDWSGLTMRIPKRAAGGMTDRRRQRVIDAIIGQALGIVVVVSGYAVVNGVLAGNVNLLWPYVAVMLGFVALLGLLGLLALYMLERRGRARNGLSNQITAHMVLADDRALHPRRA